MLATSDVVITPASAANQLRSQLGVNQGGVNPEAELSQEQLLQQLNRTLRAAGKPTVTEIDKTLPEYNTTINRLKKGRSS
jgi:hypothetical protein